MVDISSASSSASNPSQSLCKVCNARYAIYTCPRCKIRTCSLPCSSSHKSATNCSGERDKSAFVNMKDYTWGTLMSDYTYLEDVGRKVADWGATISKGAYTIPQTGRDAHGMKGRGMRGGRGQYRGRGGASGVPKTKRDVLKMQLEMQDVSMDLLPPGMEKRQHNQSIWDFKNQTALLTIEFKFYPPQDPTSSKQMPSFSFLTHRNNTKTPLLSLVANQVRDRHKHATEQSIFPSWLLEFVEEISTSDSEQTTSSPFDSLIRAPILPTALTITGTRPKAAYHRILPTVSLLTALRNTHFVEYPTLELWPQGEFSGIIADQHAETQAHDSSEMAERRAKRRKIELKAGKKAISGLLDGYGSQDESGQEGEEKAEDDRQAQSGLKMLGAYSDSDDQDGKIEVDSDEDVEVSPEVLLELMRKAQGRSPWPDDSKDDERVDWGDDDSEGGEEEEGEQEEQG
ncbi:hypothetical protein GGU10DRAFT_261857 [Lentinula aff. detonsa]|uniref:HIT-type domain-containing protein n=1 Tax=Lentinula aff. detonsa TaxID=2804958 RepID=A0AA38L0T1_9AGAR|nr:hypothetical protein GGU10DRAFT_261857 [Lentinula aff. detonsa]